MLPVTLELPKLTMQVAQQLPVALIYTAVVALPRFTFFLRLTSFGVVVWVRVGDAD
jgi:hypothetical protein